MIPQKSLIKAIEKCFYVFNFSDYIIGYSFLFLFILVLFLINRPRKFNIYLKNKYFIVIFEHFNESSFNNLILFKKMHIVRCVY